MFAGLTGFRIFVVFAEAEVVVSQTLAVIMMACFIRAAAILDDMDKFFWIAAVEMVKPGSPGR